jgi:hypothetical protein
MPMFKRLYYSRVWRQNKAKRNASLWNDQPLKPQTETASRQDRCSDWPKCSAKSLPAIFAILHLPARLRAVRYPEYTGADFNADMQKMADQDAGVVVHHESDAGSSGVTNGR